MAKPGAPLTRAARELFAPWEAWKAGLYVAWDDWLELKEAGLELDPPLDLDEPEGAAEAILRVNEAWDELYQRLNEFAHLVGLRCLDNPDSDMRFTLNEALGRPN